MKQAIIDGNMIKTKQDLHNQLAKQLGFPSYYGNNLDAFHDCLSELQGACITIRNLPLLSQHLGDYLDGFFEVILDVCKEKKGYRLLIEEGDPETEAYEEAELFE